MSRASPVIRQRTWRSSSEKNLSNPSLPVGVLGGDVEVDDEVSDTSSGIGSEGVGDGGLDVAGVSTTGSSITTKSSPVVCPKETRTEPLLRLLTVELEMDEVSWVWNVPAGKNSGVSRSRGSMVPPAMTVSVSESTTKGCREHSRME